MQIIYFDNNSTTKIDARCLAKMNEIYASPLNASATHQMGRKALAFVEEARQKVKNVINGQNYEVIFTSGSSEANNMLLFGCDATKILFSAIEHASIYNSRPKNKEIIEISALKNGLIDILDLEEKLEKISDKNFLVSIGLVNNESGAIQDLKLIAKLVHQKGGLIHSDIVQGVGKIKIDLEDLNIDFASISSHKIKGPQGVGALLMRKGLDVEPLIYGAKQEKSKRAGTYNVAGIAGFGVACDLINIEEYSKIALLRDFLEKSLKEIAGDDVEFFAGGAARIPNTSYVGLRNCDNQTQLINFDLNGICLSAGAACSSGTLSESRVLKAMQVEKDFLHSAIRVSLSLENTKEEVEKFIKVWSEFYSRNKN
jgi:cysteine desulfurase